VRRVKKRIESEENNVTLYNIVLSCCIFYYLFRQVFFDGIKKAWLWFDTDVHYYLPRRKCQRYEEKFNEIKVYFFTQCHIDSINCQFVREIYEVTLSFSYWSNNDQEWAN